MKSLIINHNDRETARLTELSVGELDQVYHIQAASTLGGEWADLGSVTNNHLSSPFVDGGATENSHKFYRLSRER